MVGRSVAGLEDRVTRVDRRFGAPVDLAKDPSDSDPAEDWGKEGKGGSRESTGSPRAVQQLHRKYRRAVARTHARIHTRTRTRVCYKREGITPAQ